MCLLQGSELVALPLSYSDVRLGEISEAGIEPASTRKCMAKNNCCVIPTHK